MDFRRRKLWLALYIMGFGMVTATLWHEWQGLVLGRPYPWNTYLYESQERFTDFSDHLHAAALPCPYTDSIAIYYPFAYIFLRCFVPFETLTAIYFFLGSTVLGLALILAVALRPIVRNIWEGIFYTTSFLLFSFPLLICIDRGNIEILLAVLVAAALLCFRGKRFYAGYGCLLSAICLKGYPVVLLIPFLRRSHFCRLLLLGLLAILVSLWSISSFAQSMDRSWGLWQRNMTYYNQLYVVGTWGTAGSASPWNTFRAMLSTGAYCYLRHTDPAGAIHLARSKDVIGHAYQIYVIFALFFALGVASYALLIERELFRRTILVLLLCAMIAPNGADYKLLFANIALVALILLPTQRTHDLLATGLLAFAIIPKKEIFLTYLGASDSLQTDVSIAVLINVPCMITAMYFLMSEGFRQRRNSVLLPFSNYRLMLRTPETGPR